ncbi:MAG: metallophosphoesterase [Ectothiorhodospiraceae bacterium]|nr:metallophosphoesterase [Ectothiorhodospiraceae bacterium]MCH8504815.1 metallophosphoesterase [Ectothiorhodospiraceae bacterium]
MSEPGRSCPLDYRTNAAGLAAATAIPMETAYVIGGLYGNLPALDAIEAMARAETGAGLPAPVLVFNGDFNWFNAENGRFAEVNSRVLRHTALQGNVETELARPIPGAGCGCAYPEWVESGVVERSNRIMERLQQTAANYPDLQRQLAALPRQLALVIGGHHIGVVHGDPDALAGWGLAVETMPPAGAGAPPRVASWFEEARADVLACSHTCLPYMQDFTVGRRRRVIVNNGAAGMANFRGDPRGLVSRLSLHRSPHACLYGTLLDGLHCDALAVPWDQAEWLNWFDHCWPADSPAAVSYRKRISDGPEHALAEANRLAAEAVEQG